MSPPSPSSDTLHPTDAPHPFNQPSADLILRTADLVDFRVQSTVLALASPFFAAMFALPQPVATTGTSCPHCGKAKQGETAVIPVSEDSATLDLLLRIVYPILKTHSKIEDPQAMVPALLAAMKYEMDLPVQMLSERLVALTPAKPLQVWGAASRTGLEGIARQAADALKASWTPQANKEALTLLDGLGDMTGIAAGDYYRLKRFLVGDTVPALLSPPTSKTDTAPTIETPSSPFFTHLPGGDLRCQPTSRHGPSTPFLAHQVMLPSHSAVLKKQILSLRAAASSASSSHSTEPMVLDFDEETDVVSDLLAVCYGGEDDLPADLTRITGLLAASRKYDMTRVARWTRHAWDVAASLRPLEAYFVALAHGLTECAKAASRYMLARPIADAYNPAMENAPALSYHRLLEYYDACQRIVRERLVSASSRIPVNLSQSFTCPTPHSPYHPNGLQALNIPATSLVTSLRNIANTARPGAGLKKVLRDTATQAGSGRSVVDLPSFAGVLVQYILSTPDEIEVALDNVRKVHSRRLQTSRPNLCDPR